MSKEEQKKQVAFYQLMADIYKNKYKVRTWLFEKILLHMLNRMQEGATICFIMKSMREHKTVTK